MVSCLMGDSTALASAIVRCCLSNYRLLDELSRKGWRITMKGYNHKRRMLFVRITAAVLAVLMVATVFTVLLLQ